MPVPMITLAAIRQPALLYDADGRCAEANEAAQALAGRPLAGLRAAEVADLLDVRGPDGAPLAPEDLPVARVFAGGGAVDVPLAARAADGRTLHLLVSASPLREGGRVVGTLECWQDVTAVPGFDDSTLESAGDATGRKEVEGELRRSLERLGFAQRSAKSGFWDWDAGTDLLTWSPELFDLFGVDRTTAPTFAGWLELIHPDDRRSAMDAIDRALDERVPVEAEYRVLLPGGRERWIRTLGDALYDGDSRPLRMAGICVDITDQKRTERALRTSEERLRLAQESAGIGTWDQDTATDRVTISPGFLQRYGLEASSVTRYASLEVLIHPGDRERVEDGRAAFIAGGQPRDVEFRVVLPSGEERWIQFRGRAVAEGPGTPPRVIGVLIDVTDRRRAEEALRESEAKYRSLVDLSPDGILVHRRGTIVYANPAAARILGAGPATLVGADIFDYVHSGDRASVESRVRMVEEGGATVPFEELRLLAGGEVLQAEAAGGLVTWEGAPAVQVLVRDITVQKRAETVLRESEAKYRRLVDDDITGHVIVAPDGRILDCNPAFTRIFGYPSIAEARSSNMIETYNTPAERERRLARLRLVRRLENVEGFRLRRDGTRIHVAENVIGDFDDAGRLVQIRGYISDDSERYWAREALKESEERQAFLLALGDRLRDLAESSGITAAATEMIGRYLGASGVVFCEVDAAGACTADSSGWTDGTVPGAAGRFRPDDLGIDDEYRRGVVRRVDEAAPGAPGARALLGVPICRAGRLAAVMAVYSARPREWTDAEVELVREVGDRTWVAVHRARTEAALREREQTLQGIFRAAPVGIGLVSHRTFTQANDRFCRMTGYARDELIGEDARLLYLDDEAYEHVGREKYARIVADGIGAVETRWQRKDGTVMDVLLSSSPIDRSRPDEDVVFSALDITRLRESERALETYMDDLQRSNEELQRFAYVASHDLQEPLRSIISFSQLLERRYRGKLDQDADEYIGFIVEGGNRMQALILDLLQLSRVETKARPLEPTDAGEVVARALRLMETSVREAGATIEVGELPRVMADAAQLEQVFVNLVGNALKYRRPDVPPAIRISAERANGLWRFSVTDNGIGIEAEYFDRIFVIFQRLHTRTEFEGTGIGLAVVKRIVERHGGRIGVASTPGEGSTFFFTLPAA